jgi:hypothetical protein
MVGFGMGSWDQVVFAGFDDDVLRVAYFTGVSNVSMAIPIGNFAGFSRSKKDALGMVAASVYRDRVNFYNVPILPTIEGCESLSREDHNFLFEEVSRLCATAID